MEMFFDRIETILEKQYKMKWKEYWTKISNMPEHSEKIQTESKSELKQREDNNSEQKFELRTRSGRLLKTL